MWPPTNPNPLTFNVATCFFYVRSTWIVWNPFGLVDESAPCSAQRWMKLSPNECSVETCAPGWGVSSEQVESAPWSVQSRTQQVALTASETRSYAFRRRREPLMMWRNSFSELESLRNRFLVNNDLKDQTSRLDWNYSLASGHGQWSEYQTGLGVSALLQVAPPRSDPSQLQHRTWPLRSSKCVGICWAILLCVRDIYCPVKSICADSKSWSFVFSGNFSFPKGNSCSISFLSGDLKTFQKTTTLENYSWENHEITIDCCLLISPLSNLFWAYWW